MTTTLSSLPLPPSIQLKLAAAGFTSVGDFDGLSATELAEDLAVEPREAQKLLAQVRSCLEVQPRDLKTKSAQRGARLQPDHHLRQGSRQRYSADTTPNLARARGGADEPSTDYRQGTHHPIVYGLRVQYDVVRGYRSTRQGLGLGPRKVSTRRERLHLFATGASN